MPKCQADSSIERILVGSFQFPLGVYPVEEMTPKAGYTIQFEPADGDDDGEDWEEWPDRYVFDIVVSAERIEALCRALFALMPGRIYPILDVLGHDAYREIDPYISYELMGQDRLVDALRRYRDFFFEDGMCGFGAMSEDPFFYFFVDEHKIVTVRADPDMKERVEKVLQAFDLEPMEDPAGADSAAHEHRGVLITPDDRPDLIGFDEIVEMLKDDWRLLLNVDGETNLDDTGAELGPTPWRCVMRMDYAEGRPSRYAEILLVADSLRQAEELSLDAVAALDGPDGMPTIDEPMMVSSDRLTGEHLSDLLSDTPNSKSKGPKSPALEAGKVLLCRWLE